MLRDGCTDTDGGQREWNEEEMTVQFFLSSHDDHD